MSKRKSPAKIARAKERSGRRIFGWGWLGTGLLFLLVAAIAGYATANRENKFARQGRTTKAMVLRKWISTSLRGTRGSVARSYRIDYRFTAGGSTIQDTASVSSAVYDAVSPLDLMPVLYLPADLQTHRLTQEGAGWAIVAWMSAFGAPLSIAGAFILRSARDRK